MTIDVIDGALAGAPPTTYTGPGTVTGNCEKSAGVVNRLTGFFTSDGNVTVINTGFAPQKVTILNITDVLRWEWQRGMAATDVLKSVTAGDMTVDAGSTIVVASDAAGNDTVTLNATICGTSKLILFEIAG